MVGQAPARLRLGPLTVYVTSCDGCPDVASVAASLPANQPVIWLDSARHHAVTGRWSLLAYDPWLVCVAHGDRVEVRTSHATQVVRADPLEALRQILRRYAVPPAAQDRLGAAARAVGLTGFLSYELNRWIEALPAPRASGPLVPEMVWFGMQRVILVDHLGQRSWLLSVVDPHSPQPLARREAMKAIEQTAAWIAASASSRVGPPSPPRAERGAPGSVGRSLPPAATLPSPPPPSAGAPGSVAGDIELESTMTRVQYEAIVARALEFIRDGDVFQANLAQRFTARWDGEPLALYRALRRINPSPFACFLSWGDLAVVSCSPERLIRVQDGRVDTRPIAGTRPRGGSAHEDALNSLDLLLSEKERAEHIMLVDLERNDLGRVCTAGSVVVDELMTLEEYSHVMHIVSNVSGSLRAGADAVDVIRAVFPGGTITGCPKVRCMEIIRQLEPVARGLYSGSLGYLGFDGTMDLNIAIRTIVLAGRHLSFHVGAGIVADSVPEREYHETLDKARALMNAIQVMSARPRNAYAAAG